MGTGRTREREGGIPGGNLDILGKIEALTVHNVNCDTCVYHITHSVYGPFIFSHIHIESIIGNNKVDFKGT